MTTDELITHAIHMINTNQPRMANLYMKNALEQTDQKRRELNPIGWQVRKMSKTLQVLGDGVTLLGKQWAQVIEGLRRSFAPESGIDRKANYALVGPSK